MSSVTYPITPMEARAEFPYALNFSDNMLKLASLVVEALAAPFVSYPTSRINTMNRHSLEDIGLNREQISIGQPESFWRL